MAQASKGHTSLDQLIELSFEDLLKLEVTGAAVRDLAQGLSPMTANPFLQPAKTLPFSVELIPRTTLRARGLKSVTQAAENLPGVISGESPAEPSSFSMRGFSRDGVRVLRDGINLGPASMTMRPLNTFNLQQVEVTKGAVGLAYGPPTAGGTINMITRKPSLNKATEVELLASKARFNSSEWGLGIAAPLAENAAYRVDANYAESNGWVDNTHSSSFNLTASYLWKPSSDLSVYFGVDRLEDELPGYWGTPLLPMDQLNSPLDVVWTQSGEGLDESVRFTNYNVSDNRIASDHTWWKAELNYRLSSTWMIKNRSYFFEADRAWKNAESYVYNPTSNLIDRDRFFVFHDHKFYGNTLSANGELTSYASIQFNVDYQKTDFVRSRGFPSGDSVTLDNPDAGLFGPEVKNVSPTDIAQTAVSIDYLHRLSDELRLNLGIRKDWIDLVRDNFDADGVFLAQDSFDRVFTPLSYFVGASWAWDKTQHGYLHWATGGDPVGSNIFLVNANEDFEFTHIRQVELGYKAHFLNKRAALNWSAFKTWRKHLLLLTGHESVGNQGSQSSLGYELALSYKVSDSLGLGGNISYTKAEYEVFIDPDFAVDASGNPPPNVPKYLFNFWVNKQVGQAEVGLGARYVDGRFSDAANHIRLRAYWVFDALIGYQYKNTRLAINVRNLSDEDYVPWGDIFYPGQLAIASPRQVELSVQINF